MKKQASLKKIISYFAAAGVLVPTAWVILYLTVERNHLGVSRWRLQNSWIDCLLLMSWPSSFFMLADPEGESVSIPAASVAVNVMLYALIGWLFFIGLTRSRVVLGATIILIVVGWYEYLHFLGYWRF